uniref:Uncharacterized protein n=2 Tax=Picea TaxID=3328 RepID=A0A117NI08_PICGL|nr:hypothetical protein ABT39_MTgene3709 [Picea glauca]QHR90299.1 hypothetical protein Q903MT_gene4322 [Picea sitchensis]
MLGKLDMKLARMQEQALLLLLLSIELLALVYLKSPLRPYQHDIWGSNSMEMFFIPSYDYSNFGLNLCTIFTLEFRCLSLENLWRTGS